MPTFEKYFTLEEANALLPELRSLLERIREIRDRVSVDWDAAAPALKAASQNGGGRESHPYLSDLHELNARIRRLVGMGIQLKDVDRGLVDFPAWREDREVFLCWHLGEERVAYWHELETGFRGRQPL